MSPQLNSWHRDRGSRRAPSSSPVVIPITQGSHRDLERLPHGVQRVLDHFRSMTDGKTVKQNQQKTNAHTHRSWLCSWLDYGVAVALLLLLGQDKAHDSVAAVSPSTRAFTL